MKLIDDVSGGAAPKMGKRHDRTEIPVPRLISEHAVIGNLRTTALVGTDGTIDFMCSPDFDSPTIFCAILDPERGGSFELRPDIPHARPIQMYIPDTNVLLTRWLGDEASVEIIDFMPLLADDDNARCRLVRRVRVTRGSANVRMKCAVRTDYARKTPEVTQGDDSVFFRDGSGAVVRLRSTAPLTVKGENVIAEFAMDCGETVDIVLEDLAEAQLDGAVTLEGVTASLDETVRFWQDWAKQSTYGGRWREAVNRSALTLKLLTSSRHGSIAAAATFGLPETPGGTRNWDYRATWIRDASFTVYALMRLGYQQEAAAFTKWVAERADVTCRGHLQIMYKLDGGSQVEEADLDHLAGYGGARPVRAGNNAATQLQLDIYGELLDSIYLSNKYGDAVSQKDWLGICDVVDHVCEIWQTPDAGIWEIRSQEREHLHSQLMCWVAVDRALRLAQKRSLSAPFDRWIRTRNEITRYIWETYWDADRGYFVKSKGSGDVDGAILMMPLVRFISATDPAWLSTLDAIGEQLTDDSFVMRYRDTDGLDGDEGSFAACSFWYVECLARAGRLDEARLCFEKLLLLGNHVGLYAEEFDHKGGFLGNFPQALTHLALISAAVYLDRALDGRHGTWRA